MSDENATASRTRFWIKCALVVSLSLNLAMIGLLAGFAMRGPLGYAKSSAGAPSNFGLPYLMALDREDRKSVAAKVRGAQGLPDRRARRQHFQDVLAILRQEPVDRAALADLLQRQATAVGAVQKAAQEAWLDRIEEMSTDKRRAYADRLEHVLKRGPKHKGRKQTSDGS